MLQWSRMTAFTTVSDAASRACLRLSATHCGLLRHSASGTVGSMAGVQRSIVLLRDCAARGMHVSICSNRAWACWARLGDRHHAQVNTPAISANAAHNNTPKHELRSARLPGTQAASRVRGQPASAGAAPGRGCRAARTR